MKNENMMKNNNVYVLTNGKTVMDLARSTKFFLMSKEKMEAQIFLLENGSYLVQGRARHSTLKSIAGMDKVITVKFTPVGESNVVIEIGKGKWIDKAVGGTLGWFLCWPLAFTTAYGAYKQGSLPRKVMNNVELCLAC